jgi:branched-chain amino acid transport system substrate-binding protein
VIVAGVSQTGASALNAKAAVQSTKAAADVLNKAGGVAGHKVEVEVLDDQGQPTAAVSKLQERLRSGPKPNLVLPGNTSAEALPSVPVTTANKVLVVTQASSASLNDPKKYPYTFTITPSTGSWAAALVDYVKSKGKSRIAILNGTDAYGSTVAASAKAAITAAGLTLTGAETYQATDLDMTAQLQRLKATNPDFLYLQGFGAPVGHALEGRVKLSWTDTPVVGDSTTGVTSLIFTPAPTGLLNTPAEQNLVVQTFVGNVKSSAGLAAPMQAMIGAIKVQGEIQLPLNTYSAYDAVMLAAYAAEKSGSLTDAAAQAKILESDLSGVANPKWGMTTRYSFTAESHALGVDAKVVATLTPTALTDGQYTQSGS